MHQVLCPFTLYIQMCIFQYSVLKKACNSHFHARYLKRKIECIENGTSMTNRVCKNKKALWTICIYFHWSVWWTGDSGLFLHLTIRNAIINTSTTISSLDKIALYSYKTSLCFEILENHLVNVSNWNRQNICLGPHEDAIRHWWWGGHAKPI